MAKKPVTKVTLDGVSVFPQWYIIVSKFNWEKRLAQDIMNNKSSFGLDEQIIDVLVPIKTTKTTTTNAKGKIVEKVKEEKLYPLYVFVKCTMDDKVWNFIANSEGSQTILAPSGTPTVMEEKDILKMKDICGMLEAPKKEASSEFKVNDYVLVLDGPFKDQWGPITSIKGDKAKVQIGKFPIELNLSILEVVDVVFD